LAGLVVMAGCGTSTPSATSASTSTTTTRPVTKSSSSSSPGSTTTSVPASTPPPAGSQAWIVATLPVVPCQTSFAVTPSATVTPLPTSVAVSVPAGDAAGLSVYGDDAGIMMLVGPATWTCHGLYGADGSGGLLISPAGESVPSDADPGWHLSTSSSDEAIVGYETGGSPVQGAALACPLFPSAAATTKQDLGQGCAVTRPSQESVSVSGTAGSEVGFEDPVGIAGDGVPSGGLNPAGGVMLYLPAEGKATAYLATCTLPASQHDVCTAVLDHFVTQYG
jgi:hypothetical protein